MDDSRAPGLLHPDLSHSQYIKLSALLDESLEMEPETRGAWLEQLARSDQQSASLLREMFALQHTPQAERFLETRDLLRRRLAPLVGVQGELTGRKFGPYRVLSLIGDGGMGSVWLAERADGLFARQVALKLIHPVLKSRVVTERFAREREILASLSHPNIARLLDAGFADDGQPYLALDYVVGTPLTTYCDDRRLSIPERLKMFRQVLSAVQYAHTHLVIHRDLKPSNILVTKEGQVQLLDFGIAKLLTEGEAKETELTQLGGRAFTPDYAAPEQVAGAPITTAADVYALGVMLYELLTGERPYKLKRESRAALEEAILQADPAAPSRAALNEAAAAARATTAKKLSSTLRGDLDTIVLKALKKSPAERYTTVDAFLQDTEHYLKHEPIAARADSAWYQLRKFVARHRMPVSAGITGFLLIVAVAAIALLEARAAASQRDRALALSSRNEAVTDFLNMLITEAANSDRPVTVSDMLARSEALANSEFQGSPDHRAAVLGVLGIYYHTMGDQQRAEPLLRKALDAVQTSADVQLRSKLTCDHALTVGALGRVAEATSILLNEVSTPLTSTQQAAECLEYLAYLAQDAGNAADALKYGDLALERLHKVPHPPLSLDATFLGSVGYAQHLAGHNDAAEAFYASALLEFSLAGRDRSPDAVSVRNNWAIVSDGTGNPRRSLELYDQTLRIASQNDPAARPPAYLLGNRAYALEALGRYVQARDGYQECEMRAVQANATQAQAFCLLGLVKVSRALGDSTATEHYLQQASALIQSSIPRDFPPHVALLTAQGRIALDKGALGEARSDFDAAIAATQIGLRAPNALLGRAELNLRVGQLADAEADARRALGIAVQAQGGVPHSRIVGEAWLMIAKIFHAKNDSAAARDAAQTAFVELANTVDENHPLLLDARKLLGGD
jgi:eukaryotic-like serine/threonine-protein kinase